MQKFNKQIKYAKLYNCKIIPTAYLCFLNVENIFIEAIVYDTIVVIIKPVIHEENFSVPKLFQISSKKVSKI